MYKANQDVYSLLKYGAKVHENPGEPDKTVYFIDLRVIEEYDGELPYLLEASGQTPPEDVGGVGSFVSFREIMLNPEHPEYAEMKEWSRYWTPELREWERKPKVIHI